MKNKSVTAVSEISRSLQRKWKAMSNTQPTHHIKWEKFRRKERREFIINTHFLYLFSIRKFVSNLNFQLSVLFCLVHVALSVYYKIACNSEGDYGLHFSVGLRWFQIFSVFYLYFLNDKFSLIKQFFFGIIFIVFKYECLHTLWNI